MGGVAAGAHVDPSAVLEDRVSIAPGAVIGADVVIGFGAAVGSCAVIHPGVRIGAQCVIEDCAVLGKQPRLRSGSSAAGGELGPLELEPDVTICCGAVVYDGARIAAAAIIGDQAQIRERATVGRRSVVGRGSCVDFDARVGAGVLIQTGVYVTAHAVVEDDVFLGPGVQMTNDHTMGRHGAGDALQGPVLRRACRIGGGAVLLPGVEVGEEAFVAAGSVVTRGVGMREVVIGVPARSVRRVPNEDLIERWG
jgi:UDP-3-O-[3-hydroxymyristoyl] glucosamine N-acyltransferase